MSKDILTTGGYSSISSEHKRLFGKCKDGRHISVYLAATVEKLSEEVAALKAAPKALPAPKYGSAPKKPATTKSKKG